MKSKGGNYRPWSPADLAALDDSGISQGMTEAMQETLCECMASARMRERFG